MRPDGRIRLLARAKHSTATYRACSRFKFMAISRQDRFSIRSWLGRSAFVRL